jgi:uncharacterized membrane protein YidH (DUF202 family)
MVDNPQGSDGRTELAQQRNELAQLRNDLAQERTDLALIRTITAAERTLMAWIRTSLAMIGFGFSMYKLFEYITALPDVGKRYHAQAPRNLGLAFIGLGTIILAGALVEHIGLMKRLGKDGPVRVSFVLVVAALVIFLGLLTFLGVVLQAGPF